ncbi:MAG: P-II family nitrogen regulator [Francisellaceae bacterium]|jgi:nitrogen regulatory protein P-II 2|nr:P-II family nitrogen regulator [Francisellaceae bacterium]MBT6208182.1 P-II family nitrogen regulator [Francisellaceae bacterium]MBT6538896.1 P-II family nitrogen regulator [Francisellaceae bacterium]
MKLVKAIIKPFKLDDLRDELQNLGISGMTVMEVKGFGQQDGKAELYHGSDFMVDFMPKLMIEIMVNDDALDSITSTILRVCNTGKIGDGKIMVLPIDDIIRIRTGESGKDAV